MEKKHEVQNVHCKVTIFRFFPADHKELSVTTQLWTVANFYKTIPCIDLFKKKKKRKKVLKSCGEPAIMAPPGFSN